MRYQSAQNLSAEKLMALAVEEDLNSEAAREFAGSFSSENEKIQAAKLDQLNKDRVDDMKEMMREVMANSRVVTSSFVENNERSKSEYKERLAVEQERLGKSQDQALNYATRNNVGVQQVNQQASIRVDQQAVNKSIADDLTANKQAGDNVSCPHCMAKNIAGVRFCEDCGNEI